ncbi:hypothetical protein DFP72DRAFT_1060900 [Ephemerocybe angulata]|uniref:RING-type domain-containing protein n=1 Tax=Ephemerocybe angulata TaxID=980116 RepID=A0A8H6IE95_9AGAR|nr:hypothetical protein DFP72DRAFT_1060900 [Tulosesus angulatus]
MDLPNNPGAPGSVDRDLMFDLMCAVPMYSGGRTEEQRVQALLADLAQVEEKRLTELGHKDGSCSICLQPFLSVLAEQEMAEAMDSPAYANHELGVCQLDQKYQLTGVHFSLVKWIQEGKDSCPMCRKAIFDPDAIEDKPRMIVYGATERLLEHYHAQGMTVEVGSMRTAGPSRSNAQYS